MGGGGVGWQNAFAPSFEFGCSPASVFLVLRGRICLVGLLVGRTVVLSEGGWLMVLVGHTSVDFQSKFNIMFSIVCLCSW